MKVLEDNYDVHWKSHRTCKGCDSKLIVELEDLYWSNADRHAYWECPCCSLMHSHGWGELPMWFMENGGVKRAPKPPEDSPTRSLLARLFGL